MPVCIAGMHRSGTSMLAKLLHLCGLSLGPPEDLMEPAADNPDGFWENRRFVAVNEELLAASGGDWDRPPAERLRRTIARNPDLRQRAAALVDELAGREPWGWKDPRNSLTLALWRELLPELRVVIALRNPLEVAASLQRRNSMPTRDALRLWLVYNRRVLEDSIPERRVISPFAGYFEDPEQELCEVLEFLDLRAPADVVSAACAAVDATKRHARFTADDLRRSHVPGPVIELYGAMCDETRAAREHGDRACVC
jgi:hypothetical protein